MPVSKEALAKAFEDKNKRKADDEEDKPVQSDVQQSGSSGKKSKLDDSGGGSGSSSSNSNAASVAAALASPQVSNALPPAPIYPIDDDMTEKVYKMKVPQLKALATALLCHGSSC